MEFKTPFPPPFFFLLKESLLFQDMEQDRQHQLCPEQASMPPSSSECFHHLKKKKKTYIPQQSPHPPSFPFYNGQEKKLQTNLTFDLSPFFPPTSISLQSVVHLLHRSLFQQLFETCKRNKGVTAQHRQEEDAAAAAFSSSCYIYLHIDL